MSKIKLLLETLEYYLNNPSSEVADSEILQLTDETFLEIDPIKFSVILSNKIVEPIVFRIKEFEIKKKSLGTSRSYYKERSEAKNALQALQSLLVIIFKTYSAFLKDDEYYKDYLQSKLQEITKLEKGLLEGNIEDSSLTSIMYPTYFDTDKVEGLSREVISYFSNLYLEPNNHEYVKNRILVLYQNLQDSIGGINKSITINTKQLNKTTKNLKSINDDQVVTINDDKESIVLKDYYLDSITSLSLELENLNAHKGILQDMFEALEEDYPFVSQLSVSFSDSMNVFGDSDFEKVKGLVNDFKHYEFVTFETTIEDLIDVFTINDSVPKRKINLTNGTLNDFAYLIIKLRPYFVDSISNGPNYAQWWSERFTFKLKDKNKKAVSNIMSAVNKNAERRPSKPQTIMKIVKNLEPILQ